MTAAELEDLRAEIQFETLQLRHILDPFCGATSLLQEMFGDLCPIIYNDIHPGRPAHTHLDALQPASYVVMAQRLRLHQHVFEAMITSPPFKLLDLAIPLLVLLTTKICCIHIHMGYLTEGPHGRSHYLGMLAAQQRLHVISCRYRGVTNRRTGWLCIFPHRKLMETGVPVAARLGRVSIGPAMGDFHNDGDLVCTSHQGGNPTLW